MRSLVQPVLLACLLVYLAGCPTANQLPIANSGPDQQVTLGDRVSLDGSASTDIEGDTLTYQWLFTSRPTGSIASLSDAGTASPSFTPDLPGVYALSLTVFDMLGSSAPDTVTITVVGNRISVPAVTGLPQAEATTSITDVGLVLGTVTMESSPTVAAGLVIRQNPAAETEVIPGSAVEIVVSTGPATVTVPDLTGQDQADTESTLVNTGLVLGTVTYTPDENVPDGEVISQSIAPDTLVDEGTTIDLVVSAGAPIDLRAGRTFDLHAALDTSTDENVLRPSAAAANPANAEVYVTALLSPHVAIVDSATGDITGTLDSGFVLPGAKFPFVTSDGSTLYVMDFATEALARIDLTTGMVTATASIGSRPLGLAVDTARDTVYLARTASPNLVFLNATTLTETGTLASLDGRQPTLQLDAAGGKLYLMHTAEENSDGTLSILDTSSNSITDTVTFDMPGSGSAYALQLDLDPENGRFFIRSSNGLGIYNLDGTNPRSIPLPSGFVLADLVYVPGDTPSQRLVALGLARPTEDRFFPIGARVFAFNPNTGQVTSAIDTVDLGETNTRLALNTTTGALLSPDSATGLLWTFDASPFPNSARGMGIGLNIDQLQVVGNALMGASRFANNTLFRLSLSEGVVTTFQSGRWPAPFRVQNIGTTAPELVVLDAWDSTITSFSTNIMPEVTGGFGTGFPEGTTERLPDLGISPDGTVVAIAYPEFGQVRIRAINSGREIAVLDPLEFLAGDGDGAGGKGQLQVCFNQGAGQRLYVLDRDLALLHLFNTADSYAFLGTVDLSESLTGMADAPPTDWVFHDEARDRLYVGPAQLDPLTGAVSGDTLPVGQVIRSLDAERGLYWTVSQTDSDSGYSVTIHTVSRSDNTIGDAMLTLDSNHPIAPEFAFDTENRRFYVGYSETAVVEEYLY